MKFIKKPNTEQLNQIKKFLFEEDKFTNQGFYCNWENIEISINKNQLFAFEYDGLIIGFLTWTANEEQYVTIDNMEINPKFRKNGFGKTLYYKAEEYFKEKKYIAFNLICAPESSEKFWIKMGFSKFPNRGYSEPELTYYKPLIQTKTLSNTDKLTDKIELWNLEPYQIKAQTAKWIWKFEVNKYPIFIPCNSNWNLRLTMNGQVIKEDKVKYFDKKNNILVGPFLYIKLTE